MLIFSFELYLLHRGGLRATDRTLGTGLTARIPPTRINESRRQILLVLAHF